MIVFNATINYQEKYPFFNNFLFVYVIRYRLTNEMNGNYIDEIMPHDSRITRIHKNYNSHGIDVYLNH